ncbi:MAG: galactokinase [Thermoprotei archaeon]
MSAAINKYMHIALNTRFEPGIRVSYSTTEIVEKVDYVRHPTAREALKATGVTDHIEVVSLADVPASAGLGSSGSYTVGLLNALYTYKGVVRTKAQLAEEACHIAMDILGEPSGKQDEYVAAHGGINAYTVDKDGSVTVEPLRISDDTIAELESSALMFYTGITRKSSEVLTEQAKKIDEGEAVERMHTIKKIGYQVRSALEKSDIKRLGELLHEHWQAKRGVTQNMTTSKIDEWYKLALENGAIGGKLIGAGGGGYLLFICLDGRTRLREALRSKGLVEHRYRFDYDGTKVVYNV